MKETNVESCTCYISQDGIEPCKVCDMKYAKPNVSELATKIYQVCDRARGLTVALGRKNTTWINYMETEIRKLLSNTQKPKTKT